jgi:hypothetical protein
VTADTEATALHILRSLPDSTPADFGRAMWSVGGLYNTGRNRKAGVVLRALVRKGLVRRWTTDGHSYLYYAAHYSPGDHIGPNYPYEETPVTDPAKPHEFVGPYLTCDLDLCGLPANHPRHDLTEHNATTGFRHGETYDVGVDYDRLNAQSKRVYRVMADHEWRTLREVAAITGDPEASISARLRDFRKPEFGGMTVERRRRGGAPSGTWEYLCPSILPPPAEDGDAHRPASAPALTVAERLEEARAEGWQEAHDEFCIVTKPCAHINPHR